MDQTINQLIVKLMNRLINNENICLFAALLQTGIFNITFTKCVFLATHLNCENGDCIFCLSIVMMNTDQTPQRIMSHDIIKINYANLDFLSQLQSPLHSQQFKLLSAPLLIGLQRKLLTAVLLPFTVGGLQLVRQNASDVFVCFCL